MVVLEQVTFLFVLERVRVRISAHWPATLTEEFGFIRIPPRYMSVTPQLGRNRFLAHYLHFIKHSAMHRYIEHDTGNWERH